MTTERLILQLEARIDKYEKNLAKASRATDRSFTKIEHRGRAMEKRMAKIGRGAGLAFSAPFLAAIAGSVTLRGAQQLIDAATRIENALKIAGLSGEELAAVYDDLFDSAQRNAAPLEALVKLYGRAALAQNELGVTTAELTNFAENVAVALRVSGQSAEASRGALLQLSQAIGAGVVRAEEFNSILEGALPIAQAAAAGLEEAGGSVAKLRQLVVDGKVSSEAFFRAFEAGSVTLEEKVAGAAFTTSQRFVQLTNVLIDVAGKLDDTLGASERLGGAVDVLASRIASFGNVLDDVGKTQLGGWIGSIIEAYDKTASFIELLGGLPGLMQMSMNLQKDLVQGNPIGSYLHQGNISSRIDGAFAQAENQTTEKTGRLPATIAPIKRVKLSDFKAPTKGGKSRKSSKKESDYQREVEQIKARTAAIIAETQAMAGLNPMMADYDAQLEKAKVASELLAAAQKSGLSITPELRASIESLAGSYSQASIAADQLRQSQEDVAASAQEMSDLGKDVLGGFISDMKSGKSAADALAGALDKIADKLLDSALDNLFSPKGGGGFLSGLFSGAGGLFGGAIIPGILHDGGTAGVDGYGHGRAVSPKIFANAPRYHNGGIAGLKPNEVPAILQRGEVVIPNGAKATQVGPQGVHVTVGLVKNGLNIEAEVVEVSQRETKSAIGSYDRGSMARHSKNNAEIAKRTGA